MDQSAIGMHIIYVLLIVIALYLVLLVWRRCCCDEDHRAADQPVQSSEQRVHQPAPAESAEQRVARASLPGWRALVVAMAEAALSARAEAALTGQAAPTVLLPLPLPVLLPLPYLPYAAQPQSDKPSETVECTICLEPLKPGQLCSEVPSCRHVFHGDCLGQWARSNGSCPLCRAKIVPGSDEVVIADDMV